LEGSPDFNESAPLFDGPLKGRKQLANGAFEEWLYAPGEDEGAVEETEQQTLEAQWAEEDLILRLQMAGYIGIPAVFIGGGIISLFTTSLGARLPFFWVLMNLPLLTLAVITWRRSELRFGLKRPVRGQKARIVAVLLALISFVSFVLAAAQTMMRG